MNEANKEVQELRAALADILPMAEARFSHECEHGGYDPINGDWAAKAYEDASAAINRARALLGMESTG